MKTQHTMAAAGLAAAILGGFFLMKRRDDAPSTPPPASPSVTQAPPAATAAAAQAAGSGAVPGTVPAAPVANPGDDGSGELSDEEKKRLIEFEKSLDMIDTPSGKRPRRPF
jgi:zona occludens toxin (predicted ATPase)